MSKPLFPDVHVNGTIITAIDIAAEAQNHSAPRDKPGLAWRSAARALAVRALLLQEAARRGIKADPQTVSQGKRETEDEALIRALLEEVLSPAEPEEAEIRAFYDADPTRFRAPALFEAAHMLFAAAPDDATARGKALARATAALTTLAAAPDSFDALARAESDCPSGKNGGRLGQIMTGDTVPEFEAALVTLTPGQISPEPVVSRYGLHVVRLDAHAEGAVLPYEAVRTRILEALEKHAWARAAQDFTEMLVAAADITGIDFRTAA